MSTDLPVLKLKRGEDRRIRAGHPWVFSNEIDNVATPLAKVSPGAAVRIHSDRDQFLGHAYVNPHALICARIVGRDVEQPLDRSLIVHRLNVALALRERLSREPYYRLVFGESDGLPGLVLDRYGDIIVGQIATRGMDALRKDIEEVVRSVIAPRGMYWKNDSGARELEQLDSVAEVAFGEVPDELEVIEAGLRFAAPLAHGQKTGWFYDQTANRARLARYLLGRRARARCLQLRGRVGRHRARSRRPLRDLCGLLGNRVGLCQTQRRGQRHGGAARWQADAFDALKQLHEQGERFDVVILDPPAFIKRKKDIPQGTAAYRKLNQLAMNLIGRDGLLRVLLVLLSPVGGRSHRRHPGRGPPRRRGSRRFWRRAGSRPTIRCTRPFPRPAT